MKRNDAALHMGFFKNFKASDTLLLEDDAAALGRLAAALRSLAQGDCESLALHKLPFVEVHHGVEVTAEHADGDNGIRCTDRSNAFVWQRNEAGWHDAAKKVKVLIRSPGGHHYLDAEADEVTVEVSKGEFGDDWWAAQN